MPHPQNLLPVVGERVDIQLLRTGPATVRVSAGTKPGIDHLIIGTVNDCGARSEDGSRPLCSFDSALITHSGSELSFGQAVAQLVSAYLDETP